MLKSLEISGFKSFGKKTELLFSTPITSIVGPNGSGKSNVAEAFQFVLGEQSIKSMRGKRGEDLIFNGGKSAARANRASVKVVFDNTKKILNIDFDEVSIERVVHRDGVNEYLINGTLVRLKDIVEILAAAHIGPSGHHIISQGEADRILNANIKERREIVEEALGLKIYQWKREESERKLEKTEENVARIEGLRKEIAPHLRFLKKQMEKLEKALEMRRSLAELYKVYFAREERYLALAHERIRAGKHAPVARLHELDRELVAVKNVISESKQQSGHSVKIFSLEKQIAELRNEKDSLSRELGRIEGEFSWQERSLKKEKDATSHDQGRTVLLSEVEDLNKTIESEALKAESSEDIEQAKSVLARIRHLITGFIKERRASVDLKRVEEIEKIIAELNAKKTFIEMEIARVVEAERGLNMQLSEVKREIEKEKEGTVEAEKSVFRIMAEQQELHSALSLLKGEEDRLRVEEEEYNRELQEAGALLGEELLGMSAVSIDRDEQRTTQLERRKSIEKIKIRLEESGIAGGAEIKREYEEVEARNAFFEKELTDLHASGENLKKLIKELEIKIDEEFKAGVKKINTEFHTFFAVMFGGGEARLDVVKPERRRRSEAEDILLAGEGVTPPEEEVEEGIDIHVSLPHKKIKGLTMLSGGERALTSIALLFAMSRVNPPPFVILDETDAALDEANSRKYGDMIENLSKLSQLILITHNRETMSRAGVLYGVTMGSDGVSKLLSIAFEEAVVVAK